MVFIAILKPEVRSLILATIILDGTRRFKSQPPHQLSTWLLAPPVSTVHAMPWRKDHSVSPQMSPSRPDGSLRGWMKGKFYRTTSGRFKKLSNNESQENSSHAESAYPNASSRPSSQTSSSATVIETPLPNNDLEKTDSHIAGVSEGEYSGEKKPVEEPELVLPQEKPSSKVIDDSHLSSPPENDLDHVENDVSQNKDIGLQGSMVKKQEPSMVETKPAMEDNWNSCLLTFEGHQESVQVASWMSNDRLVSASFDGTVKMWDTSTSHCVSTFTGNGASISSIGCLRSPNIGLVLGEGRIEIWDTREDYRLSSSIEAIQPLRIDVLGFEDTVELFTIASWSHEGALAYATEDGLILIHHVTGMTRQDTSTALQGRHRGIYTLAWSHDGRIASGAKDGSIKIWDAADGQCKLEPGGHSEWVYALAWSKDCRRLASASKENIIKIWETKNGLCTAWVEGHSSLVRSLSWSPDGRLAGADGEVIRIWDSITGKFLSVLEGHSHQVWSVAWSENGTRLASASRDKTIKIWDVAEDQMERTLLRSNQRISGIFLPADESRPASICSRAML